MGYIYIFSPFWSTLNTLHNLKKNPTYHLGYFHVFCNVKSPRLSIFCCVLKPEALVGAFPKRNCGLFLFLLMNVVWKYRYLWLSKNYTKSGGSRNLGHCIVWQKIFLRKYSKLVLYEHEYFNKSLQNCMVTTSSFLLRYNIHWHFSIWVIPSVMCATWFRTFRLSNCKNLVF